MSDTMNMKRALWAATALQAFIIETGTDFEDSLGDLLADLMHWANVCKFDFDAALIRARAQYAVELVNDGEP